MSGLGRDLALLLRATEWSSRRSEVAELQKLTQPPADSFASTRRVQLRECLLAESGRQREDDQTSR